MTNKPSPRRIRRGNSKLGGNGSKPINVNSRANRLREMYERAKRRAK